MQSGYPNPPKGWPFYNWPPGKKYTSGTCRTALMRGKRLHVSCLICAGRGWSMKPVTCKRGGMVWGWYVLQQCLKRYHSEFILIPFFQLNQIRWYRAKELKAHMVQPALKLFMGVGEDSKVGFRLFKLWNLEYLGSHGHFHDWLIVEENKGCNKRFVWHLVRLLFGRFVTFLAQCMMWWTLGNGKTTSNWRVLQVKSIGWPYWRGEKMLKRMNKMDWWSSENAQMICIYGC